MSLKSIIEKIIVQRNCSHDWLIISSRFVQAGMSKQIKYQCSKCGKIKYYRL